MHEISDSADLQGLVSANDVVFLDIYATWCGPCKKLAPVFQQLSEVHQNAVFVASNCSDSQEIAHELGVSSIPTFIVFIRGVEAARCVGGNVDKLRNFVAQYSNN